MNYLQGIDVSKWQGKVDWKTVKNTGEVFYAFCKATESTNVVDGQFSNNWAGIKDVDLVRGAYHFGKVQNDAKAEADFFTKTVGEPQKGDMLVLDIEVASNISQDNFVNWVLTFMETVKNNTSINPIIYTGGPFFNQYGGKPSAEKADKLRTYPLWLAAYVSKPDNFVPDVWKSVGWKFWQCTGDQAPPGMTPLKLPGINGVVDRNYFNGSLIDLKVFAESLYLKPAISEAPVVGDNII